MIAATLAATILAALATASSVCLGLVRAHRETVASTLLLQERLEQLRGGGWTNVTDSTMLCDQVLGRQSAQEPMLTGVRQQITVSPYPEVSPAAAPLKVEKSPTGAVSVTSQPPVGFSLRERISVRVDLRVEWTSRQNRRPRSRETSSIVAVGGLLR